MSDKSHVSLEQRVCIVCGKPYDTGCILLDRRLRQVFNTHTTTGWGLCPEHQKLHEEGFIALIECDAEKSGNPAPGGTVKPENAHRTGLIAQIRREAFSKVFDLPYTDRPCVFVEVGTIERLQANVKPH